MTLLARAIAAAKPKQYSSSLPESLRSLCSRTSLAARFHACTIVSFLCLLSLLRSSDVDWSMGNAEGILDQHLGNIFQRYSLTFLPLLVFHILTAFPHTVSPLLVCLGWPCASGAQAGESLPMDIGSEHLGNTGDVLHPFRPVLSQLSGMSLAHKFLHKAPSMRPSMRYSNHEWVDEEALVAPETPPVEDWMDDSLYATSETSTYPMGLLYIWG